MKRLCVGGNASLPSALRERPRPGAAIAAVVAVLSFAARADTVETTNAEGVGGFWSPFSSIPSVTDWNWVDSPFKPIAQETLTYNTNVAGLASGFPTLPGMSTRGDFLDLVQIGDASKFYFSGQQFFVDANYGVTRYFRDVGFDSSQYLLDAGVNWTVTSRCSGTVRALESEQPTIFEETVGVGVNNQTFKSLTETAKCGANGGFYLLVNSGLSQTLASLALDQLNDNTTQYFAMGGMYEWAALDNLQVLYTATDINYLNRAMAASGLDIPPSALGLAQGVLEKDVTATYVRYFSPLFSADLTAGLTDITLEPLGGGGSPSVQAPHGGITLTWQATPKAQLIGTISRTVGPPTSLVANYETTTSAQLTGAYALSPKLSFNAGFKMGQSNTGGQPFLAATPIPIISTNQNFTGANLALVYQPTPFVSATASYQYTDRKEVGFDTAENLFVIGLKYAPY